MAVWLVTGGNGFVGRHVLEAARRPAGSPEAEIVVLGRRPPERWRGTSFIEADLNDPEGLRGALRGVAPDFVIHTAGKTPPASRRGALSGQLLVDDASAGRPAGTGPADPGRPGGLGGGARPG